MSDRSVVVNPEDLLFIGAGKSPIGWYRMYLPALHMGADWVGVYGEPPTLEIATGLVRNSTTVPNYGDYKVILMQQPRGPKWLGLIRDLQDRGIKVIFEIDDYLHGVRKQKGHDFARHYDKKTLAAIELCMRNADALLCSTEWLGKKYRAFNKRVFVCENAIDTARYRLTIPERPTINVGWAGATGHTQPILPWLSAVASVMMDHENVAFVAIGQPSFATPFEERWPERSIGVPWTLIENYPAAMTMMDIAIAPAGKTSWYRGKSDLRWLEAGALGIPIIADPDTYPKIEHGVNGFHAETQHEVFDLLVELVEDDDLRHRVGAAAQAYVREERDISKMAGNWLEVARMVANDE